MPIKQHTIEDVFPANGIYEFISGFESESTPGTLWYVVRDIQTGELKCTCRGYLRSKNRECIHVLTVTSIIRNSS
jgi:hypothetical protein